jgi:hypothetical protein
VAGDTPAFRTFVAESKSPSKINVLTAGRTDGHEALLLTADALLLAARPASNASNSVAELST